MDKRKTNILLALLVIAVALVFYTVNPPDSVYFHMEDDVIYVEGPEEFQYSIPVRDVEKFVLVEDSVYANGQKTGRVVCGRYANDSWGEHIQCAHTKIPVCIAVIGQGETILFNVESEETTRSLYKALLEYPVS